MRWISRGVTKQARSSDMCEIGGQRKAERWPHPGHSSPCKGWLLLHFLFCSEAEERMKQHWSSGTALEPGQRHGAGVCVCVGGGHGGGGVTTQKSSL